MRDSEHQQMEGIESLGPEAFADLHAFCLFIGYPKSGHSLVGALLDAHPDVIMGKATNPLTLVVVDGYSREQVLDLLIASSRSQALRGRKQNRYVYAVEGQWQGRARTPRVIGDKFSDRTTKRISRTPGALAAFQAEVALPLRLIHVTRNPFDIVARLTLMKDRRGTQDERIAKSTAYIGRLAATNAEVIAAGAHPVLTVRHESLIADPEGELTRLCRFLEVDASADYLADCASIIFPSPQRSRELIDWKPDQVEAMERVIASQDFFAGYELADPRSP